MTLIEASRSLREFSYTWLAIVALVPSTPIIPERVASKASRTAGPTVPIIGTGSSCSRMESAVAEAVLQATTTRPTSCFRRNCAHSREYRIIVSTLFVP